MPGIQTALSYDIGTDQDYDFTIYTDATEATVRDFSAYGMSFMVKRKETDADAAAYVTKTTSSGISISGSFNSDPAVNTLKATVSIFDTDTDARVAGSYRWELKRTDAGSESRIGYGVIVFNQTVHRT